MKYQTKIEKMNEATAKGICPFCGEKQETGYVGFHVQKNHRMEVVKQ